MVISLCLFFVILSLLSFFSGNLHLLTLGACAVIRQRRHSRRAEGSVPARRSGVSARRRGNLLVFNAL
jgi:hypothetical protein